MEKQEAMRVLNELKSVISVRAVEINKREQAALRKMYPDLHKALPREAEVQQTGREAEAYLDISSTEKNKVENLEIKSLEKGPEEYEDNTCRTKEEGTKHCNPSPLGNVQIQSNVDYRYMKEAREIEGDKARYIAFEAIDACDDRDIARCHKPLEQSKNHKNQCESSSLCNMKVNQMESEGSGKIGIDKIGDSLADCIKTNQVPSRNCKSYISQVGVRRLRKNVLELCDSESDEDRSYDFEDDEIDESDSKDENGFQNIQRCPRIGLPLLELTSQKFETEEFGDNETEQVETTGVRKTEDVNIRVGMPALTLEERLKKFCSSGFSLPPNLAADAVAKSKSFSKMEEETFGGEVYGELSEEENSDTNIDTKQ